MRLREQRKQGASGEVAGDRGQAQGPRSKLWSLSSEQRGIIRVVLRVEVRVEGGWDVTIRSAFWKEGTRETWGDQMGGYFGSLSEGQ